MSKPKKKRNKTHTPKPARGNMWIGGITVLIPLAELLRQIEVFEHLDSIKGEPVFLYDGTYYPVVTYLDEITTFMQGVFKKNLDLAPFLQIRNQLNLGMLIPASTLNACKTLLPKLERALQTMKPQQGTAFIRTHKIKQEFEKRGMTNG